MKLVELIGLHIESSSGAPLVLLREHEAPHRVVPIFVGAPEAVAIAAGLNGDVPPRPMTHDVMAGLIETLDAHVLAVEVTGLRDGAFLAELAVTGPHGARRVDSRPSDAIALAVRLGAPLFVAESVLDAAGTMVVESAEEDSVTLVESTAYEPGTMAEWGLDDPGAGEGWFTDDDLDALDADAAVGGWLDDASVEDAVAELRRELDVLEPADFDPDGPPSIPPEDGSEADGDGTGGAPPIP